jgi:hypothetical protein
MSQRSLTACLSLALLLGAAGVASGQVIHRYTFNGINDATDSVGTAHGTLLQGATTSGGHLQLTNGPGVPSNSPNGRYLSLPTAAFPTGSGGLTNYSIEMWVNWVGGNGQNWARLFDFNNGPGGTAGADYAFLAPQAAGTNFRYAITDNSGAGERFLNQPAVLPSGTPVHIALTYDTATTTGTMYVNASQVAQSFIIDINPSLLNFPNLWIGRSAYNADPFYNGTVDELTVWNRAMTPAEVSASFAAGPVPAIPEPSSFALAGVGAIAFVLRRYRKTKAVSPSA